MMLTAEAKSAATCGDAPWLSVVIPSVNGYRYVARCLQSWSAQSDPGDAEVVVLEASRDGCAERLQSDFPWARVLARTRAPIPELRAQGIRLARGALVATAEDHCVFAEDWCCRVREAHGREQECVVGGAVEIGSRRYVDLAMFLVDYAPFMPPLAGEDAAGVAAPNASYPRGRVLAECSDLLDRGAWEGPIHHRLAQRGVRLALDPERLVFHVKEFGIWEAVTQRYFFGRAFAADRAASLSTAQRFLRAALSPAIPPLLVARCGRTVWRKRRFLAEYVRTFPLLAILAGSWSIGEMMGYACGDGGASVRVE